MVEFPRSRDGISRAPRHAASSFRAFTYFQRPTYYRLHTSAASSLKKKKTHNPQATGQKKSENCGPTTRRIDSAAVGRIKGIPIHPPEGSCSGYPLIPYSAASDACSRRCVNPAAILSSPRCRCKINCILSSPCCATQMFFSKREIV
jgi:hypothetical protein